jgi:polysaccharide deacetylase family protein (PEP-CTERM system associated)
MNALTFDLEDWYHPLEYDPANWRGYSDRIIHSTKRVLQVLGTRHVMATFFVLGDIAQRHPDLIREIHECGHEVASHGMWHRLVYTQTPEDFEADVAESLDLLASITGATVLGYRAPYFSITRRSLWALPILARLGVKYDSSIFPVLNHRYGIPGAPRLPHVLEEGMLEIPPTTFPVGSLNMPIAGGVYFRVMPYRMTRALLRRVAARREPLVFYLHPWELDHEQPRVKMPAGLRWRHYWHLDRAEPRLAALIDDFSFGTVREAFAGALGAAVVKTETAGGPQATVPDAGPETSG